MFASTTTDASGNYLFSYVPGNALDYYIVVPDPTNTYNLGRLDQMSPGP